MSVGHGFVVYRHVWWLINLFLFVFSLGVTCVVGPSYPKFYIKPVTAYGEPITGQDGSRLSEEGTFPFDGANCCQDDIFCDALPLT